MKILAWMQNKLNGSNGKKKPNSISDQHTLHHESCKQEFSDWPEALLAIGTLGNKNLKEKSDNKIIEIEDTSEDDVLELTPEDAANLQNEFNSYLQEGEEVEDSSNMEQEEEEGGNNTDQILNQHFKENDEMAFSDGSNNSNSNNSGGDHFYPNIWKDLYLEHNSKGITVISRKSLVVLLKKMFVRKSGSKPPAPTFKDPLSTKQSRMEKILRAILHKKIYPQGARSAGSAKKYLGNSRRMPEFEDDGEEEQDADAKNERSKWDKTDSEYIVLEI